MVGMGQRGQGQGEMRDDIAAKPSGARFFRADLHIHSHPASHDVTDTTCTPEAVVATAKHEGLDLLPSPPQRDRRLTSRGSSGRDHGRLPCDLSVELSTQQGHLLCYLPTPDALQAFYGRLTIRDKGKDTCHCTQSMTDCLDLLAEQQGFGVLAHVDLPKGFRAEQPHLHPFKTSVLTHPALLGIELSNRAIDISLHRQRPGCGPPRPRQG